MVSESIRAGMQVIGSDGGLIGRVGGVHGNHIHVAPDAPSPDAPDHTIPADWVARVDDHVHLNVTAAVARERWGSGADGFAAAPAGGAKGAKDGDHGVGRSWIGWAVGLVLLVLVVVIGVRACSYGVAEPDYADDARGEIGDADRALSGAIPEEAGAAAANSAITDEVAVYFASAMPAPRTFQFQNLHFDTGSAAIGSAYRAELADLGRVLAANPQAKVRVVGYADARGAEAPNRQLGKQRAEAVAAALVANGVSPANVEAVSGGETDPPADNRTAAGQAENRRTELVILSR